ncbi:glycosyl transferase family 2 [Collibacillus ludicampi]|uniref:Glycosyl transferase family 2 n=1 Tax=Collibacillus ludicampi TaxID=2771369 RepID=A0AAV4LJ35_9BACL|nr:glycosyltransferase family 2 protein [Collibacillus ludicampi]GIM47775.1 glycosyl transferase family 2 [Collibacillus ludicampi]
MIIVNFLINSIQVMLFIVVFYQLSVAIFGFRRHNVPSPSKPTKRFAIVIPAHNEERVIGQLVQNLLKINYPRHLYDIFVICDNCTDRTMEIAIKGGAYAVERFDSKHRGKGYALSWMFHRLLTKEPNRWDAFVILDADNLVSPNFLEILNTYLQNGYSLLQACLDVKNPDDSWISKCYALSYWATNRIFQLARYNLGWSCVLGGTGICVETKLLEEIGWNATSLTEDLEFTLQCMLAKNIRATWVHEAKIYDEKPVSLAQSIRQRIRWMQGHADCCFRYIAALLKQGIKTRNPSMVDLCMYLIQPFVIVASGILIFAAILQYIHPFYWSIWGSVPSKVRNILLMTETSIPFFGLICERVSPKRILSILYLPVFSLTWIPLALIGIFRHKARKWTHTEHYRVVTEEELFQLTGLAITDDTSAHQS